MCDYIPHVMEMAGHNKFKLNQICTRSEWKHGFNIQQFEACFFFLEHLSIWKLPEFWQMPNLLIRPLLQFLDITYIETELTQLVGTNLIQQQVTETFDLLSALIIEHVFFQQPGGVQPEVFGH